MGKPLVTIHSLLNWYKSQRRVLPWRDWPDGYRVWISEIMLQQTQVATVIPYFERFIARFPAVEDLAGSDEQELLRYWAGLGYYARARNLRRAAQKIVEEGWPKDREGWLALPGVGRYTAGAVLSIAFNRPEPILDGNVERVLSRYYRIGRQNSDSEFKARLWARSEQWMEEGVASGAAPRDLNQALMELGALICSPRSPRCLVCPLQTGCAAFAAGEAEAYPGKRPRPAVVQVQERRFCLLDPRGRVLLRQNRASEWRAGLWDFCDELPVRAEKGEVERIGVCSTRYVVTHHQVSRETEVWRVRGTLPPPPGFCWSSLREPNVPVGSPFRSAARAIQKLTTIED